MSQLLKTKSNEDIIYSYIGFFICRDEIHAYENSKRTGTAALRNPSWSYDEARAVIDCYQKKVTKLEPISIPIFNDVRECLFQNDSHIFNCKEELNELTESIMNPANYAKMLKWSTQRQREAKRYNHVLHSGINDMN